MKRWELCSNQSRWSSKSAGNAAFSPGKAVSSYAEETSSGMTTVVLALEATGAHRAGSPDSWVPFLAWGSSMVWWHCCDPGAGCSPFPTAQIEAAKLIWDCLEVLSGCAVGKACGVMGG